MFGMWGEREISKLEELLAEFGMSTNDEINTSLDQMIIIIRDWKRQIDEAREREGA